MAESVRDEAYETVRRLAIPVIFEAQRLGDPRELRDAMAGIGEKGAEMRHSGIEVKTHTTKEHVEEALFAMLLQKLEEYGAGFNLSNIALRFDDVAGGQFKQRDACEARADTGTRGERVLEDALTPFSFEMASQPQATRPRRDSATAVMSSSSTTTLRRRDRRGAYRAPVDAVFRSVLMERPEGLLCAR